MRASIIAVIFAISLITAVIAFSWHKSGAVRAFLFQLALVATLISGFLSVGFEAYSKKVYTSSRLETSRTLKLVAIKNTSYYLVRNGEEYYYKYIDENGNVKDDKIDVAKCEVDYDKNSPKLTVEEVSKDYHREWLFILGGDATKTETNCIFIVQNEESILDLNDL